MSNIFRLFKNDLKRITSNTVTRIIVLGLILLPSIFVWYNILACWNVFNNVDDLTVAVANSDEGYESDLVPIKVNLGDQVISGLRADDEMNWVFVDAEEAVDGVESGRYYAAVVIPESFSRDMMTFYSEEVQHAQIVYYSNEKKNVVAPKLTDQGADRISHKVNELFAQELADVGLSVASSLSSYADEAGVDSRIGDLADHVDELGGQLNQTANVVASYASVLEASESLIEGSATLLRQAGQSTDSITSAADEGKQAVSSIGEAATGASEALGVALDDTALSFDGVAISVENAFSSTSTLAGGLEQTLRDEAASVGAQAETMNDLVALVETLKTAAGDEYKDSLQTLIDRMNYSITTQQNMQAGLVQAADALRDGTADAQTSYEEIKSLVDEANGSASELAHYYRTTVKPNLDTLSEQISSLSESLSSSASSLSGTGEEVAGSADSVASNMANTREMLVNAAAEMRSSAATFSELSSAIQSALASDDVEQLRKVLGSNTDELAQVLGAPVALERIAVFPAEDFGSQMAPLYATLGLWIGALLMCVGVRTSVSRAQRAELPNWKLYQLFLGRFGLFSVLSFLQSSIMATGNMLFLGVQYTDPLLYLACFWIAGQVFTFICYTLVVSFANLGKAIAVFLLIIQVTSGGGSFPLQMLPDFFQTLSPFLPATHVINAMRAAMMGVYEYDFFIEIGTLLLFVVPFLLLGLALRKPLMKFLGWYVEKVEESKLIC